MTVEINGVEATAILLGVIFAGVAIAWAGFKYVVTPALAAFVNDKRIHPHFRASYDCPVCDWYLYESIHGGSLFPLGRARLAKVKELRLGMSKALEAHWAKHHGKGEEVGR